MPSDDILPPVPSPAERPKKRQRKPLCDEELDAGYGVNQRGEDRYKIRYQRPEVAKHCARVLVANAMDYDAAVGYMFKAAAKANKWEPASDAAIIRHAELLKKAPQIQQALREYLQEIGLDKNAHKIYRAVLWGTYLDRRGSDARWSTSAKQLGLMLQVDKKQDDAPVPLQLKGADGMLKRMGLPINDKIEIETKELEDEGPDERSSEQKAESDAE